MDSVCEYLFFILKNLDNWNKVYKIYSINKRQWIQKCVSIIVTELASIRKSHPISVQWNEMNMRIIIDIKRQTNLQYTFHWHFSAICQCKIAWNAQTTIRLVDKCCQALCYIAINKSNTIPLQVSQTFLKLLKIPFQFLF